MTAQIYNNTFDTLANGIDDVVTSFDISSGDMPAVDPGDYIPIHVIRASDNAFEIMHVTGVSGTTLTVERAAEAPGDSPLTFNSGDRVEIRPTRQSLLEMLDIGEEQVSTSSGEQTVAEALDNRVIYVDTIADLHALTVSELVDGQQVQVKEYHAGTGVGGGEFYWDASSTDGENGGTVFGNALSGRWIREDADSYSAFDFGLKTGGTSSENRDVFERVCTFSQNSYKRITYPPGVFNLGGGETKLDSSKPLFLTGSGKGITVFEGKGRFLTFNNTHVKESTLSADIKFKDTTISVSDTSGVQPGMLMVVRSTELFEETERTLSKDASFVVTGVDIGSVTVKNYSRFKISSDAVTYTITVRFYNTSPIELAGFSLSYDRTPEFSYNSAILIDFGKDLIFRDISIYDPDKVDKRVGDQTNWYQGIQLNRSADAKFDKVSFSHITYGVPLNGTSNVEMRDSTAFFCRHITTPAVGAADTRHYDCTADACFGGFDSHQGAMDSYFYNCVSTNDTEATKLRGRMDIVDGGYYEKLAMRADSGIVSPTGGTFDNLDEEMFVRKDLRNCVLGKQATPYFGSDSAGDGLAANVININNVRVIAHGMGATIGRFVSVSNYFADYRGTTASSRSVLPSASEWLSLENVSIYGITAGSAPSASTTLRGITSSSPYNNPELYINNFYADGLVWFIRSNVGGDRPNWRVLNGVIKNCTDGISLATDVQWGALDNIEFSGNTEDISGGTLTRSTNSFTL